MTTHPAAVDGSDAVVAGLGSVYRHDDAVGAVVSELAARLAGVRDVGPVADPLELLDRWDRADLAVVVDAIHSGFGPGAIRVMDLTGSDGGDNPQAAVASPQPSNLSRSPGRAHVTSSHGIDLFGVLRLARAVGTAPARVVLVGVEGEDFSPGIGLTPRVAAAVPQAVGEVVRLVQEVRLCA